MKKVISTFMAIVALVVVLVSCSGPKSNGAIDAQHLWEGELTVFSDGSLTRVGDVVDYVEGDPASICGGQDVIGIYVTITQGSGSLENCAVLSDGSILPLETEYKLLPRSSQEFSLKLNEDERCELMLTPRDSYTYDLTIVRDGVRMLTIPDVSDAWLAYDAAYWLRDGVAYSYEWRWGSDIVISVLVRDAYAILHHAEECGGALAPYGVANYNGYGRSDIVSPKH